MQQEVMRNILKQGGKMEYLSYLGKEIFMEFLVQ